MRGCGGVVGRWWPSVAAIDRTVSVDPTSVSGVSSRSFTGAGASTAAIATGAARPQSQASTPIGERVVFRGRFDCLAAAARVGLDNRFRRGHGRARHASITLSARARRGRSEHQTRQQQGHECDRTEGGFPFHPHN